MIEIHEIDAAHQADIRLPNEPFPLTGQLIEYAAQLALRKGCRGLYTQGQDNNLNACLFYLAAGFAIGGLDTQVYRGTRQEEKSDILFYLDA